MISITLPPLRERLDDLPLLVAHFLRAVQRGKREAGRRRSPRRRWSACSAYPWPGNVRELENVIERGVVLARGEEITLDLLPRELQESYSLPAPAALPEGWGCRGRSRATSGS